MQFLIRQQSCRCGIVICVIQSLQQSATSFEHLLDLYLSNAMVGLLVCKETLAASNPRAEKFVAFACWMPASRQIFRAVDSDDSRCARCRKVHRPRIIG